MRLSAVEAVPTSPEDAVVTLWAPTVVESDKRGTLRAEWSRVWYQPPSVLTHGTRHGYDKGCRCEFCSAAKRAYNGAWRASRKAS